jgi:Phage ABA sandwich domain
LLEQEKSREAGRDLDSDIEEAFFGAVGRIEPRFFSTEIEPAMVVLDKIHKEGWFWRLDSVPNGVIFTVQCLTPNGKDPKNPERKTFQVGAATIPLAICLGALKTR